MMSKEISEVFQKAEEKALIYRVAKECIEQMEGEGGICCRIEGIRAVAKAILEIIGDNVPTNNVLYRDKLTSRAEGHMEFGGSKFPDGV